ncbi:MULTISPECIES: hypothetical protein, partial [Pseudomonadota]|uniref:hypothetical protein n=1 Tax=Pseudomonadota TaxID=1224 RepID=UPI000B102C6A
RAITSIYTRNYTTSADANWQPDGGFGLVQVLAGSAGTGEDLSLARAGGALHVLAARLRRGWKRL